MNSTAKRNNEMTGDWSLVAAMMIYADGRPAGLASSINEAEEILAHRARRSALPAGVKVWFENREGNYQHVATFNANAKRTWMGFGEVL
jgi:hypothetical protein